MQILDQFPPEMPKDGIFQVLQIKKTPALLIYKKGSNEVSFKNEDIFTKINFIFWFCTLLFRIYE